MKISIQIPTYNQEAYISRAINSALAQNYHNLEIVVLDDNSTDRTFEIAKEYASNKVKVFKNDTNLGRVGNYRKLLYQLISGDWVVNLDGDDYFTDSEFISYAVKRILSYDNIVFFQACIIAKSPYHEYKFKHCLLNSENDHVFSGKHYFLNFFKNKFFGHLSTVYNVQVAKQVGFYEFNNLNSDAESLLKLALKGNIILSNRIIGVWSIHNNNESKQYYLKEHETKDSLVRISKYGETVLGEVATKKWLSVAIDDLHRNVLYQLSEIDFYEFLSRSLKEGFINFQFFKILLKKIIKYRNKGNSA